VSGNNRYTRHQNKKSRDAVIFCFFVVATTKEVSALVTRRRRPERLSQFLQDCEKGHGVENEPIGMRTRREVTGESCLPEGRCTPVNSHAILLT